MLTSLTPGSVHKQWCRRSFGTRIENSAKQTLFACYLAPPSIADCRCLLGEIKFPTSANAIIWKCTFITVISIVRLQLIADIVPKRLRLSFNKPLSGFIGKNCFLLKLSGYWPSAYKRWLCGFVLFVFPFCNGDVFIIMSSIAVKKFSACTNYIDLQTLFTSLLTLTTFFLQTTSNLMWKYILFLKSNYICICLCISMLIRKSHKTRIFADVMYSMCFKETWKLSYR